MIQTRALVKEYRISKDKTLRVLDGVSITVGDGEIVSIVGPSGAGKSTLLHLLGTLDKPTSGDIIFEGKNIAGLKADNLAKFRNQKIGFIFQFHHLLPEFTALENVALAAMISGKKQTETYETAKRLLDEVGLSGRLSHKPAELSGGEAQRVAIARALVNSPKVVLADEPTGNLDSKNSEEVIELLFNLKNKYNQTYLIVTHNETLASKTGRILKMTDGKIA